MSLHFSDKDVVQDSDKCFAQVQLDDASCSPIIHQFCNPVVGGHQICQARFFLSNTKLAVLLVIPVFEVNQHALVLWYPKQIFECSGQ